MIKTSQARPKQDLKFGFTLSLSLSLELGSREKRYFLAGKKGGREEGGGEEGRKEGKREGRERRREEREDSIITSKHMTSMDIDTL